MIHIRRHLKNTKQRQWKRKQKKGKKQTMNGSKNAFKKLLCTLYSVSSSAINCTHHNRQYDVLVIMLCVLYKITFVAFELHSAENEIISFANLLRNHCKWIRTILIIHSFHLKRAILDGCK